ncbi:MAG: alkaline phosphatase family protein [Gammaproteobacteria bacterium]|nr:alkaline phosphatase family protein [Gammaproteobacteria bacterium]
MMSRPVRTHDDVIPTGMLRPDYSGDSIVNLMSSIATGRGGKSAYQPLRLLEDVPVSRFRNVLVILIDGLGYQYLRRFPESTMSAHLRGRLTSVFPTTTAAAVTTFLTGLAPAQHGLTGWHVWLEEIRTLTAVLPFRSRNSLESLQSRGFDVATLLDARPIYPGLDVDSHVISPARIAYSPFNQAFSDGARVHDYGSVDQFYQTIADVVCADTAEKYIYAYWSDLDHIGHQYGIDSDPAAQHFHELDTGFARLLTELENSDTLLLLTADHGVIDTTPDTRIDLNRYSPLTAMLDVPLCGEPRAAYCYVHPGEHGAFETYVASELAGAAHAIPSPQLLEAGLFGPGEPHPRLHARVGDYTLLMNDKYIITDTVPGESSNTLIGVHGGLTAAELYVPLVLLQT